MVCACVCMFRYKTAMYVRVCMCVVSSRCPFFSRPHCDSFPQHWPCHLTDAYTSEPVDKWRYQHFKMLHSVWWLAWRSGNRVGHIAKVRLRRAQLVQVLVTTFGECAIPCATQPGRPSVGRCNEYWRWFWPPVVGKWRVLHSSMPCDLDCWHTGLNWFWH